MVFSSLAFICVFLPIVFLIYQALPWFRAKNALLIAASLLFYAFGEPVYVVLMIASTLTNWAFGLAVGKAKAGKGLREPGNAEDSPQESSPKTTPAAQKAWLACAVIVNLLFLGVFKYAGMLVESLNFAFGAHVPAPDIALPIGISFYTFQAMSYVIDVYRGEVPAERNYARVLLYISFFPQLIAGPIVKYHDIADQLTERHASRSDIASGLRRFCLGLGKKVLIANTMAVAVDNIYAAELDQINIAVAWIAAIAYLLQIYFDFSGYSDMAIGMARMFGFHYRENFAYPYGSTSVKVFWRRWHISLSTWFKEYVYIPLGGNRRGRGRAVLNKLIVFFLCGLWHGASWTFVVWGLIHGFFLLLEEYLPLSKLPKPIGWLYTMLVVTIAFVLFRADSFTQGGWIIAQMFTGLHFETACTSLALQQLTPVFLITLLVALVAAQPVKGLFERLCDDGSPAVSTCLQIASYVIALGCLALSLLALSGGGYNPFIYFRF